MMMMIMMMMLLLLYVTLNAVFFDNKNKNMKRQYGSNAAKEMCFLCLCGKLLFTVYGKTEAIRCHAVKNACRVAIFNWHAAIKSEFNKRNFIVCSLFNYV